MATRLSRSIALPLVAWLAGAAAEGDDRSALVQRNINVHNSIVQRTAFSGLFDSVSELFGSAVEDYFKQYLESEKGKQLLQSQKSDSRAFETGTKPRGAARMRLRADKLHDDNVNFTWKINSSTVAFNAAKSLSQISQNQSSENGVCFQHCTWRPDKDFRLSGMMHVFKPVSNGSLVATIHPKFGGGVWEQFAPKLPQLKINCPICGGVCRMDYMNKVSTYTFPDCPLPPGDYNFIDRVVDGFPKTATNFMITVGLTMSVKANVQINEHGADQSQAKKLLSKWVVKGKLPYDGKLNSWTQSTFEIRTARNLTRPVLHGIEAPASDEELDEEQREAEEEERIEQKEDDEDGTGTEEE